MGGAPQRRQRGDNNRGRPAAARLNEVLLDPQGELRKRRRERSVRSLRTKEEIATRPLVVWEAGVSFQAIPNDITSGVIRDPIEPHHCNARGSASLRRSAVCLAIGVELLHRKVGDLEGLCTEQRVDEVGK